MEVLEVLSNGPPDSMTQGGRTSGPAFGSGKVVFRGVFLGILKFKGSTGGRRPRSHADHSVRRQTDQIAGGCSCKGATLPVAASLCGGMGNAEEAEIEPCNVYGNYLLLDYGALQPT